ncbi:TonB-dependent receptor, partial [Xanthomonas oryzae pv. oryzae]
MTRPTLSMIGLAVAAALSAQAQAQQADTASNTLDTVIVTGTRASGRTVLESTVPVDVLTAEDIRKAGVVNGELGSALQALLPSFNFPHQSNSGGGDHIRAAQLRGLSPDQVLVLVNGKRRHTSSLVNIDSKIGKGTTPVDFNSIPINAIKRIEVLRDGAGAQYGSDAVAGVINVILDDNPESGELEASFGAYNTDVAPINRRITDGQTSYASAKVGTLLGDDGGFFKVGLELKNREATNRAGFDQIPPFEEQTPANLALKGQRNYVLGDGATKGLNAWLNTKIPFSASGEFYAFGTYDQRDSEGANYFRYPDSSANWREIYPNGYRPISEGENRDLQIVAGARGQWGNWDYDASLNYGRNDFTYRLRNSLNASLGPGSTTRFKTGDFAFAQTVGNFDLTRVFDAVGATHTFG